LTIDLLRHIQAIFRIGRYIFHKTPILEGERKVLTDCGGPYTLLSIALFFRGGQHHLQAQSS
jgi:hypothetical protein